MMKKRKTKRKSKKKSARKPVKWIPIIIANSQKTSGEFVLDKKWPMNKEDCAKFMSNLLDAGRPTVAFHIRQVKK